MDPQVDVNALIQLLAGTQVFVAFAIAHQSAGLSYNQAAKVEFLANGVGTQFDLDTLEQRYGIVLITDITGTEIDGTARLLQDAFNGDPMGRVLHLPDAQILASAYLKNEAIATGDLQLFKRARDLGLLATFIGAGRASGRAAAYVARSVRVPGGP